jgi:starvation-inducible DNA-binding protein
MANKTALKPYPVDIYKITDRLIALAERYGTVANAVWAGIGTTDEAGTTGILTGFSRSLEKSMVS